MTFIYYPDVNGWLIRITRLLLLGIVQVLYCVMAPVTEQPRLEVLKVNPDGQVHVTTESTNKSFVKVSPRV
jgi:hypothetical protein